MHSVSQLKASYINQKCNQISLIVVDDHPIGLNSLSSLIEDDVSFRLVGVAQSAEEVLGMMEQDCPNLVLTAHSSGLDLFRKIKSGYPDVKVGILSIDDDHSEIKGYLREGVNGYILKNVQQLELRNAVKLMALGFPYVSPGIVSNATENPNDDEANCQILTERESEILGLITKEFSNKQIAEKLFISERTVETHRKNIFRKTNSNSIVGLMRFAFQQNLL